MATRTDLPDPHLHLLFLPYWFIFSLLWTLNIFIVLLFSLSLLSLHNLVHIYTFNNHLHINNSNLCLQPRPPFWALNTLPTWCILFTHFMTLKTESGIQARRRESKCWCVQIKQEGWAGVQWRGQRIWTVHCLTAPRTLSLGGSIYFKGLMEQRHSNWYLFHPLSVMPFC